MDFLTVLRQQGASSLAIFGDSISVGLNATQPQMSWTALLAQKAGIAEIRNHAMSGTILQSSPLANGLPRPDNGASRWQVLISPHRSDAVAILYGYNDARYAAAPHSVNVDNFRRDYAMVIEGLLAAGYQDRLAVGSPPYIPEAGFSIGTPGFVGQTRSAFERYVHAVRSIAENYALFYAPVYEMMSAHEEGTLASADVIHPNDDGHRIIAEAFQVARQQGSHQRA